MTKLKLSSPNNSMLEGQQVFIVLDENENQIDECNLKHEKPDFSILKRIKIVMNAHNKKVIIEDPFCPHCHSKRLVYNGTHTKQVQVIDLGLQNYIIQHYKCKKCGKTFYGHLDKYIEPYQHITNDEKKDIHWLYGILHSSVRNIQKIIRRFHNINVSHETINHILYKENLSKYHEYDDNYSGYYEFDEEWVEEHKKWSYRYTLFDSIRNIAVYNKVYSESNSENFNKFLDKALINIPKKAITTDLDPKLHENIEKRGLKHQYCLKHTSRAINNAIKEKYNKKELDTKFGELIFSQKKEIMSILYQENYNKARKMLDNLMENINDYEEPLQSFIKNKLYPEFRSFTHYMSDDKIQNTTNLIENYFQKTMPKHEKRQQKTTEGITHRINITNKIWEKNNEKTLPY